MKKNEKEEKKKKGKEEKRNRNIEEGFEVLSLPVQSHRSVNGKGTW